MRSVLWLALIPFATLVYAFSVTLFYGPTGAPDPDPAYYYLLNTLNLIVGYPIEYLDQPGTPVQMLGAVALSVTHALYGSAGITEDLLTRPGMYAVAFFRTLAAVHAVALAALGYVTWRRSGRTGVAVAVQGLPQILGNGSRLVPITSECLLPSAVAVLLIVLAGAVRGAPRSAGRVRLYGAAVGLGIAVKITFVPLALLPLALLRTAAERVWFAIAAVLVFALCTAPIWPGYPRLLKWVVDVASHEEQYGQGRLGLPSLSTYLGNLVHLIAVDALLVALVLGAACVAFAHRRAWSAGSVPAIDRLLIAVALAGALHFALVATHPEEHYLVPLRAAGGFFLWLLIEASPRIARQATERRLLALGVLAAVMTLLMIPRSMLSNDAQIQQQLQAHYRGYAKVFYAGSSSVPHALEIGNRIAGYRYADFLAATYPDVYALNAWSGPLSDWNGSPIELADLSRRYEGIVLVGERRGDLAERLPAGDGGWAAVEIRETYHSGRESISEVLDRTGRRGP
jgi:hypothetical protein